jgi:pimeloyl-ACP methyl ester carboxylesterase
MYYEVHGEGPPLLLLHGGSGSIPERWIPLFTPQFRVIAPEQMGHGRTADLIDRPFHYHDMAEDTVELMRQLGIESAVVVGYSDGGIIGLDMSIHNPERVTKLAVTGANAIPKRIRSFRAASTLEVSPSRTATRGSRPTVRSTGLSSSGVSRRCGRPSQASQATSYNA